MNILDINNINSKYTLFSYINFIIILNLFIFKLFLKLILNKEFFKFRIKLIY